MQINCCVTGNLFILQTRSVTRGDFSCNLKLLHSYSIQARARDHVFIGQYVTFAVVCVDLFRRKNTLLGRFLKAYILL